MIAAIHQPNFLPWLGFFEKLAKSDVFVLFDDVQFPRGKSYGYRTLIKTAQGPKWISVPIASKTDLNSYRETQIASSNWQKKTIKTIRFAYQKAPFFDDYFAQLQTALNKPYKYIFDLNLALIELLVDSLKIQTKLICSSDICANKELNGEEKILFILKEIKATEYISGQGAGSRRYINENNFEDENIKLVWQEFKHPQYQQLHGAFIPNLSAIDLLFNHGPDSDKILLER